MIDRAEARPAPRCTCWPRRTRPNRFVLAQIDVDGKRNGISWFVPLLDGLDLAGAMLTADALHTQREHARWLIEEKKAGCVFVVKRNQPRLCWQVKAPTWAKISALDETRDRGHGRYDIRQLQAVTGLGALALDSPYAVQALRIRRRRYNAAPARRIRESAALCPTMTPWRSRSSGWTLAAPQVPREAMWTARILPVSQAWRSYRADGGRLCRMLRFTPRDGRVYSLESSPDQGFAERLNLIPLDPSPGSLPGVTQIFIDEKSMP